MPTGSKLVSSMSSQHSFIFRRRFLPLFIAQAGGAFVDNVFKTAFLVLAAFQFTDHPGTAAIINNLAAALFIVPFLVLSPLAGQLADRADKARMIQINKGAEVVIAILGTLALWVGNVPLLLLILLMLGCQSAMFGPNKYALIPQLMPKHEIAHANAHFATATFLAILFGAICGGLLARLDHAWAWVGIVCFTTALCGYIATRFVPKVERGAPDLTLNLQLHRQAWHGIQTARELPKVWCAVVGLSGFWFLGSAYLTQLPAYTRFVLHGDETMVTLMILLFIIGLGLGALTSARLSREHPEWGASTLSAVGLSFSGMALAAVNTPSGFESSHDTLIPTLALVQTVSGQGAMCCVLLLGIFGGLFIIPLYLALQKYTALSHRARLIATNNLVNAIFMIASAAFGVVSLSVLSLSIPAFFVLISLFSLAIAFYLFRNNARETLRFFAQLLSHSHYKITVKGKNRIPEKGGALLVCNHVSYADSILLFGSIRRPVRFLVDKKYADMCLIGWVLRAAGAIPITAPQTHRPTFDAAMRGAQDALEAGELVFIFPEGRLSPNGEMNLCKKGYQRIMRASSTPMIPVALSGLWGSFSSHRNGAAFKKSFPLTHLVVRKPVSIRVGEAIDNLHAREMPPTQLAATIEMLRGEIR